MFPLCFFYTRHLEQVVQECIDKIKAMLRQNVFAVVVGVTSEHNNIVKEIDHCSVRSTWIIVNLAIKLLHIYLLI